MKEMKVVNGNNDNNNDNDYNDKTKNCYYFGV